MDNGNQTPGERSHVKVKLYMIAIWLLSVSHSTSTVILWIFGLILNAADCGVPIVDSSASVIYNSTLEGSLLVFWCEQFPDDVFTALCHKNGSWSPNPAHNICSSSLLSGISKFIKTAWLKSGQFS